MIGSISDSTSYMSQQNIQMMQQRREELFGKIDSNGDGGLDKAEFSAFAKKLSEHASTAVDAESVFSTYDTDSDGSLSETELDNFMKDNAPPPPPDRLQSVASAYGAQTESDPLSSLMESLTESSEDTSASDYLSELLDLLKNGTGGAQVSSLLSVKA